ncbi:uncharacterized protein LOC127724133 isoform X2 [Mytilus californianus]|uniref:uncharacterized protein LOC127724133 isoform X2 n=1 Tax=Mytilus californianus TaxID=6549 RepID=UPI002245C7F0|nr:uncharacterized protein LOC127724133 isoform X2 [Mytilus californianus]
MASKSTVDFSFDERDKKGNMVKNIILIGRVGAGKSATANTLCGSKTFKSLRSSCPVTESILSKTVECEQSSTSFCIMDTPGISGSTDNDDQFLHDLKKAIQSCDSGIHAILVVLSLRESFSEAVQDSFAYFSSILGCNWERYGILVFTNADQLGSSKKSQNKYISKSEKYSKLVLRFKGRYITIDNTKSCQEQRSKLFSLILETIHYNGPSVFTTECLITENKFRMLQEGSDDEKKLKRILQEEKNERERQLREQQEKDLLVFKKQIHRTFKNPDTMLSFEEADSECPDKVVQNKEKGVGVTTSQSLDDRTQTSSDIMPDFNMECKGSFVGVTTDQPPVDPMTELSELIQYLNKETEEKVEAAGTNDSGASIIKLGKGHFFELDISRTLCQQCNYDPPCIACRECKLALCSDCLEGHNRRHEFIQLVTMRRNFFYLDNQITVCPICKEDPPSLGCIECKVLRCFDCYHDHDRRHHFIKLLEERTNDDIGNESTNACAMCNAIHSLPIFCKECNIRICRKCANVHKRIPMLRSHHLEDNVLEQKETAKIMEDTICNLPAKCSTKRLECTKAKYICFECNLVFCNMCVGQHQEEEPKHRSLNADQLRICCRHQKESFEKVLKVVLSLRKKRTICDLYFHSDVVCEKGYHEKEEMYLPIECDEMKDMGNTLTLEVPQKRLIHLEDEDILWILHDTNVLRQASKSGFSRDDMKKLDPSLMFADELDKIYSKVEV